ncbi:hypothetical protein AAF712_001539 [Marasmius tenuissimus]|uniref:Uncharacterized protein n=1 Tax=Marasmius tenuissimus TaxID=585030 RepID=A0ABR3AGH7_9AGAR
MAYKSHTEEVSGLRQFFKFYTDATSLKAGPYPQHLLRPLHHRVPSDNSHLHLEPSAKRTIESLQKINEINLHHLSQYSNLSPAMTLSLLADFNCICSWLWLFIATAPSSPPQQSSFYGRLVYQSTVAISYLVFQDDKFATNLRTRASFYAELYSTLKWVESTFPLGQANAYEAGFYFEVAQAMILLYGDLASSLVKAIALEFAAYPVITDSYDNLRDTRRYAEIIFQALVEEKVSSIGIRDRTFVVAVLCKKLRLLSTSLGESQTLPLCCRLSQAMVISHSLRAVAHLAKQGHGGDTTLIRAALAEDILVSIHQSHAFVLDDSLWLEGLERQGAAVADAMIVIINYITSSLCFPKTCKSVVRKLKGIGQDSLDPSTSAMLSAAWSLMAEQANRFNQIPSVLCSNSQVRATFLFPWPLSILTFCCKSVPRRLAHGLHSVPVGDVDKRCTAVPHVNLSTGRLPTVSNAFVDPLCTVAITRSTPSNFSPVSSN